MYRLLAIAWLVGGVALIIYDNYIGDSKWLIAGVSPGWLMLAFAAYNLVRWWGQHMKQVSREAERRAWAARQPPVRRSAERQEPPDPNFIFTEEPPAQEESEKHD
jgi:hypothetical protein